MVTFLAMLGAAVVFGAIVIASIVSETNWQILYIENIARADEKLARFEGLDRYEAIAAELRRRGILKLARKTVAARE